MARITGGEWQKLVIGASKKTLHDNNPVSGEYGFHEAKWSVDGVLVKAQAYPDFGGTRWLWGVRFNAQEEVRVWDANKKENVVTRQKQNEYRTGGHAETREEAMEAAEAAVQRGRP